MIMENKSMQSIKLKQKKYEQNIAILINRYRHGDKEAFSEIFNSYFDRLYYFLVLLTDHSSNIEDILQETFLKVAIHLNTLKDERRFKEWIFTICRNTAINYQKKHKVGLWQPLHENLEDKISPENDLIKEEREKMVRQALSRLTEEQRTVIILSRYEGLDYKQIGNIMDRSENAIKALAHRAMTRLGELLERNRHEL